MGSSSSFEMSNQTSKTQWVHEQSYGSVGSSLRRRTNPSCRCGESTVVRTVTDSLNPNCGKKFWGCSNYMNASDKGVPHVQSLRFLKKVNRKDQLGKQKRTYRTKLIHLIVKGLK